MGKFESYEAANNLTDNDITLYNKDAVTYKVTFGTIINLIASRIHSISSITAGAGLLGGTITSSGTIKCNLDSENLSSLASVPMGSTPARQYAVGLDKNGKLSVNVPWAGSTYTANNGVKMNGSIVSADLKSNVKSSLTATSMGNTTNRQYAVGLDVNGNLSVNIPWKSYTAGTGLDLASNGTTFVANIKDDIPSVYYSTTRTDMANREYPIGIDADGYLSVNVPWVSGSGGDVMLINGSNADSHVTFSGAFTVGSRPNPTVVGANSIAQGHYCAATNDFAHSEGYSTVASGIASHAEGCQSTSGGDYSHAEGYRVNSVGNFSHAEGNYTKALGCGSHAEGYYTETVANGMSTTASHVEGYGNNSIATGLSTLPEEFNSNATYSISSSGNGSHAEGYTSVESSTNYTGVIQANNNGSHAEGYATAGISGGCIISSGRGSHAEGYATYSQHVIASGSGSHAEGSGTLASGTYSHAEGYRAQASATAAHAEGYGTYASGQYSHAEGYTNTASSNYSHVEGASNTARGNYSHVGGYGISYTDGASPSRFIHGGYNNKFGDASCGRGAIGFHPDGQYYELDTTLTVESCKYGVGGTIAANVTLTLTLDICAIYQLYVAPKDSGGIMVATIATASTSSGRPRIEEFTSTSYVEIGSNNTLAISDNSQLLFHLIRII